MLVPNYLESLVAELLLKQQPPASADTRAAEALPTKMQNLNLKTPSHQPHMPHMKNPANDSKWYKHVYTYLVFLVYSPVSRGGTTYFLSEEEEQKNLQLQVFTLCFPAVLSLIPHHSTIPLPVLFHTPPTDKLAVATYKISLWVMRSERTFRKEPQLSLLQLILKVILCICAPWGCTLLSHILIKPRSHHTFDPSVVQMRGPKIFPLCSTTSTLCAPLTKPDVPSLLQYMDIPPPCTKVLVQ